MLWRDNWTSKRVFEQMSPGGRILKPQLSLSYDQALKVALGNWFRPARDVLVFSRL